MAKYDSLDHWASLEQTTTGDLNDALAKRGLNVKHNGGGLRQPAPHELPDIEVWDTQYHINVEVITRTTKSNADREYLSIRDHLEKKECPEHGA